MSIAEKLTTIADNERKVYNAGHTKGIEEGYNSGYAVGNREGYDSGYEKGGADGYASGYAQGKFEGVEEGKQTERDAFWDSFQLANRTTWMNAFSNACWNDETFYPKYDLIITGNASNLFRYCGITDLESRLNERSIVLDTSNATNLNNAFSQTTLTTIPAVDLRKCTASNAVAGLFSGSLSLKTIRKIITNETIIYNSVFNSCPLLENIIIEGVIGADLVVKNCPLLTNASITSIINALSDTAEGKTVTFSLTAVNKAFETSEGANNGSTSNEWIALITPKSNAYNGKWTISLV